LLKIKILGLKSPLLLLIIFGEFGMLSAQTSAKPLTLHGRFIEISGSFVYLFSFLSLTIQQVS